ncbi:GNAT family N-acetyltransferase [Nocardioides sp.]|uniref:GNAT family N-acetyltransferase n=1 Tax=Nocardioides sp. TaxID=35761 RepID=UPI002EDA1846
MSTPGPSADVSVRVAWADDAPAIAEVQLRTWRETYAGIVPAEALPGPDQVESAAAAWRASLTQPRDARNRVLVALERNRVVGLAITTPASDPDCDPVADAELREIAVDPGERGRGHGSRLLQAAIDTMQADRFTRAVTWTMATDDALRGFLAEAGWAPDSAHRELDLDGEGTTRVKQVRLHTALS